MRRTLVLGVGVLVTGIGALPGVAGARAPGGGPMGFEPIADSAYGMLTNAWNEPFVVPEGFSQEKVSDENDLDIYPGQDDLDDMNTVNETGEQAGRYLYRTHEVDDLGSVSVVDLWGVRPPKVLVQEGDLDFPEITSATDLDGIRWTPSGTILFAEEELEEPVVGDQDSGHLYEIILDPKDRMTAIDVKDRPQVGRLHHEGIEVGSDGSVYVIDELNGGSIFRFVPDQFGDLSSGQLYALRLTGISDAAQSWGAYDPATNPHTGAFEWVRLDMDDAQVNANAAADDVAATEYGRPEDIQIIGQTLYVANQITGFNSPDNLADGPDGSLWIVEDPVPSDIWVAGEDLDHDGAADSVSLFASMKDSGAQGTGIYFGKDPETLFVNVQHAAKPLADGTWSITKG